MITKLSESYKVLSISSPTQETLTKRSNAIKMIVESKDQKWIFDCVRLYLGKQIENSTFLAELTKLFTDADPLFPQKENSFELQVLAGIIISEKAESSDGIEISLALETASFQVDDKNIPNKEIIAASFRGLQEKALNGRIFKDTNDSIYTNINTAVTDMTAEAMTAKFNAVNENIKKISSHINSTVSSLTRRISVLEEESNIHWWVFRGYSKIGNKLFSQIDKTIAPLFVGRELAELTTLLPFTPAYEGFIAKVLKDAFTDNIEDITIKNVINSSIKYFNSDDFLSSSKEVGNICPLMCAFNLAAQSSDDKGWHSIYEKSTGIKPGKKVTAAELAKQIYLEILLLRSVE